MTERVRKVSILPRKPRGFIGDQQVAFSHPNFWSKSCKVRHSIGRTDDRLRDRFPVNSAFGGLPCPCGSALPAMNALSRTLTSAVFVPPNV
jgi:hypothetical protein